MEMKKFEEQLNSMSKPEVSQLKHESMLADALVKAKDKSAVNWWWLAIPLYIIAVFIMKSFYTHTTLISSIHEMSTKQKFTSVLFFLIIPALSLLLNILSIRKIYLLSGSIKSTSFLLKIGWFNLLMIICSIFIIIIYLL